MTPAVTEESLVERLRADNDWLMRSRLPGHELRAVEAGNNERLTKERDEALAAEGEAKEPTDD